MIKEQALEKEELLEWNSRGTMKTVSVHQYGDSKVLCYEETSIPVIHPDEDLIKVHTASLIRSTGKSEKGTRKAQFVMKT